MMNNGIPCDGPDCPCSEDECTDEECRKQVQKYLNYMTRRYFRFKLKQGWLVWCNGCIADCGSAGEGSSPSIDPTYFLKLSHYIWRTAMQNLQKDLNTSKTFS